MSFILDALKKSEREREQHAQVVQPGVIYQRSHTPPTWMIVVITLLLVNMALVTVVWLRSDHQPSVPMITVNNSAPAAPATTPVAAASTSAPISNELRPLHDEAAPIQDTQDETASILANAKAPEGPPLVRQVTAEDAAKTPTANTNNYTKAYGSSVPTLDSIGGNSALNLPAMHLDIHVFSINAAERFVFINMKKYAEGQTLKEGPTLEHVTPDGAILRYQDHQFLLPRQ
jgi:general secretion pathway protein B